MLGLILFRTSFNTAKVLLGTGKEIGPEGIQAFRAFPSSARHRDQTP
jgi:hypothetical protein